MAFSVKARKQGLLPGGGEGSGKLERGTISFGAGDGTGELPLNMHYVEGLWLQAVDTAPDAGELSRVEEVLDGGGGFRVPATGTVTISRTVTTTAQDYFYLAIGR
jgi:hypothetical protein